MSFAPSTCRVRNSHRHRLSVSRRAPSVLQCIRVRRAGRQDIGAIALVCGEAFGTDNWGSDPELLESEYLAKQLQRLEDDYKAAIEKRMRTTLEAALQVKDEAAAQHRLMRLRRLAATLRAEAALASGGHAVFPGPLTPEDRRMEVRLRRYRQFVLLVAEDTHTQQVVGTCMLSMVQPEALLPPPFPSTAPFRPYLANVAVLKSHRRQGVATQLLSTTLRTVARWGHDAVWLHVNSRKAGALRLYQEAGFQPHAPARAGRLPFQVPTLKSLLGELLLRKDLSRHAGSPCHVQVRAPGVSRDAAPRGVGAAGVATETLRAARAVLAPPAVGPGSARLGTGGLLSSHRPQPQAEPLHGLHDINAGPASSSSTHQLVWPKGGLEPSSQPIDSQPHSISAPSDSQGAEVHEPPGPRPQHLPTGVAAQPMQESSSSGDSVRQGGAHSPDRVFVWGPDALT